jgi:uncharacterized protein
LLPDAQIPGETGDASATDNRPLAPWWHTALLIVVLLFASLNGTRSPHPLADHSKLPQYLWGMAWEWILFAFTWLGIRKRTSLRALIGGRWANAEEFLSDLLYAAVFWLCALFVLGLGAKLMHLDQAGKIDSMRKQLGFLTPGSHLELAVWFCLSATAGFCEEIIFRGYLQRQLAAVCKSALLGVLLSAAIFGASHGYEGAARMLLLGIFGLMFGLLAWWRKSLRPGMMAHAWHDAFSGVVLRMLK